VQVVLWIWLAGVGFGVLSEAVKLVRRTIGAS